MYRWITYLPFGCVLAITVAMPTLAQDAFVIEKNATYTTAFGDQFYGAVTEGPGEYFAVWVDLRTGGANPAGYDLYGQRILPDGTVGAPGSLELLRDRNRMTVGIPAVGWNGSVYLVAWYEDTTLYGMRVSPLGDVLDPGGFVIAQVSGAWQWPSVASDGQDFLVVQTAGSSVIGYRVSFPSDSAAVADPVVISSGASGLGFPKVTFGAGMYLVAWAQAPSQAIRAARVMPDGTVLDPGGINVSGGGTDVDAHVDFDGQNFYVVWQRQDGGAWDLWGAHVSPSAQVVSGPTLLLDGNTWGAVSSGQVAFNGTNHLITITTGEPVYSNSDLYALMVDGAGNPMGTPFPVSTLEGRSQVAYGVASVGDQFFIIWEGNYIRGVHYVYDTEGARVDAAGNVLDRPEPIAVSTCASWQIASSVSFDGENFLCVFEDWREGKPYYAEDLYAVRVSPDGQPLDPNAFQVAGGYGSPQTQPDSTFGGGQHVIVYENASSVAEVRMVRVLPDGTVLDPDGILIFANEPTADTFRPKVAWNGQYYCVIWNDTYLFPGQKPLQFALVDVDGNIVHGPANVPYSDGASLSTFDIASDGESFLVAWIGYNSLNTSRIHADGTAEIPRIVQSTGNWIAEFPRLAFNGDTYLIAWAQWGNGGVRVNAYRVSPAGAPVGSLLTISGPYSHAYPVDVFADHGDFLITGWSTVGNTLELFSAQFGPDGSPAGDPEVLMTTDWYESYSISAARAPDGTMLAVTSLWTGNPYNTPRATGQIIDLSIPITGDLDGDGDVDLQDLAIMLAAYGTCIGHPNYLPAADLNGNGCVDLSDLSTLLSGYGA